MALTKTLKKIVDENKEEIRQYLEEYANWPQWKKDASEEWLRQLKIDQEWYREYCRTLGQQ